MSPHHHDVFPADQAKSLQSRFRRLFQNPKRILKALVKEGISVLDMGCGPGFFTIEAARLVGPSGTVVAVDLQEEMLAMVEKAAREAGLQDRIRLHRCEKDRMGYSGKVDLVLAIFVVHELPDQEAFFREACSILGPDGSLLLAEPGFVVSKKEFQETLDLARRTGLSEAGRPRILVSRTALLKRSR